MRCEHPTIIYNRACDKYFACGKGVLYTSLPLLYLYGSPMWSTRRDEVYKALSRFAHSVDYYQLESHYILVGSHKVYLFLAVPCGHCLLCKDSKRNVWRTRCMLESASHFHNPTMLTLTYANEYLPDNGVSVRDVQLFFHRLRKRILRQMKVDVTLTYIVASEYGSCAEYVDHYGRVRRATQRPHYHLLVWGFPDSAYDEPNNARSQLNELWTRLIFTAWGKAQIQSFQCETAKDSTGKYVCKYITKDCPTPDGKNKPFFHASRRPSIGWRYYADHLRQFIINHPTSPEYSITLDGKPRNIAVPPYFLQKTWKPFSSYLPKKFRDAVKRFAYARNVLFNIRNHYKYSNIDESVDINQLPFYMSFLSSYDTGFSSHYLTERELETYWRSDGHRFAPEQDFVVEMYNKSCETINYYLETHPRCCVEEFNDMFFLQQQKVIFQNAHHDSNFPTMSEIEDMKLSLQNKLAKESKPDFSELFTSDSKEFLPLHHLVKLKR